MAEAQNMRTIEQGRAKFAYAKVKEIKNANDAGLKKEYKSHVKSIPMMIKTNGLAAALSFMFAKSNNGNSYQKILDHIKQWLTVEDEKRLVTLNQNQDLVEKVISLSTFEYRAVTNEIISLTSWLKRYVDGMLGD